MSIYTKYMPPFLPAINNPSTANTGLIVSGDSFASEPFGNVAYPNFNYNSPNNFNTISTTTLTPGAAQKPPLVDFYHSKATRLLGQENIGRYLREFDKKPQNIVFQDLVNTAVSETGKTFEPAGMKELMLKMMTNYEHRLAKAVNYMRSNPNDINGDIKFYQLMSEMGAELNQPVQADVPVMPVQADAVPVQPDAVPVQADVPGGQTQSAPPQAQGWLSNLKFWGGRKTARNHSRSHKHSRSRSRSRKQYKKLKRSSRSRRRC